MNRIDRLVLLISKRNGRFHHARVMFYVYAALMGFTLSSIFMVYDLGSIGVALGVLIR